MKFKATQLLEGLEGDWFRHGWRNKGDYSIAVSRFAKSAYWGYIGIYSHILPERIGLPGSRAPQKMEKGINRRSFGKEKEVLYRF